MSIELDHLIVSVRDKRASAELLAFLLDVPWRDSAEGHFVPVYVNDGLTLEFDETKTVPTLQHCCFRVSEEEFDAIFSRLLGRGIAYRSTPMGSVDMTVNTWSGGKNIYWEAPEGVLWEILTVSYARQPQRSTQLKDVGRS